MKTTFMLIFVCLFQSYSFAAPASERSYTVVDSRHVRISDRSDAWVCKLDNSIDYAVESFDRSAIIVSDRGYVPAIRLAHCSVDQVITVRQIPAGVGVLADINIGKDLYISVEFVAVQPFAYVATIAHLNSTRNLVTVNGAYKKA